MIAALLLMAPAARAVDYRFPAGDADYGYFYPTAYMDEGGTDWGCGGIYYDGHTGSDFGIGSWDGMDAGREVVAAAEGTVVATNDGEYDRCDSGACGTANYIIIQHDDGRQSWYWHLKQWTVAVSPGQWVSCGTHLAYAGSSGNSTGPHLHFEVREPNGAVGDPFDGPCSAPPTYWIAQGDYGGVPGDACPSSGPCNVVGTIACGQSLATANTAAGSTATHSVYGCGPSASSGSEIAYHFSTPLNEPVTIGVTGVGADLDLFVQSSDACDGSGAVTCSTNPDTSEEWVTFDAAAGATYTVVVDGWDGAASGFTLSALCTGTSDTGTPDTGTSDTSAVDTADPRDRPPADAPGSAVFREHAACGCTSTPGVGGAWLTAAAVALLARRRSQLSPPSTTKVWPVM